jgi:hypothetical protein
MIALRLTSLLWLVPAAMLLAAPVRWPYVYYRLLRWVVFVCCAIISYRLYERRDFTIWFVGLVALAVFFNPIVPIHLTRAIWMPINIAGAVFLAAHMWVEERGVSR